jgi:methylated-DNA-protein-cysteine methyltransferase-like protein
MFFFVPFPYMNEKKKKPVKKIETARPTTKEYSFFADVFDVVRQIPKGRVTSYGAIAKYLGTARSSRMVGWAMNTAHAVKPKVPAHRVVNRVGLLTGKIHFGGSTHMQELLEKEKIKVKNDKIVNFQKHFWDPVTELDVAQ